MKPEEQQADLKIVVVCVQSSEEKVRKTISLHAPGWESLGEIAVVPIPDQWRKVVPAVSRRIEAVAPKASRFVQILILDNVRYSEQLGGDEEDLRRPTRISSLDGFGKKLPEFLRGMGLDWLTSAERRLSKWRHGIVDKGRITLWLRQFAEAGSNQWVGEGLLRALDFWSEERLISAVDLTPEILGTFDQVCMHRLQPGKSADVLANLFTKQIKPLAPKFAGIGDLHTALATPAATTNGGSILFLEDGLFSGTEMIKLLSDLLGLEAPEGRNRKAPPLADKALLASRSITLLFPVATSFGVARLESFLRENDLANIEVSHCAPGFLEVLSPAGHEALLSGTIYDTTMRNCPADPDLHFLRPPFQHTSAWKTPEHAARALALCKEIGSQLFQNYLKEADRNWPAAKVQRCALGMYGMGLTFAFTHSIPKATLPLFWAGGKVKFEGKTLNWVPLFPNAA